LPIAEYANTIAIETGLYKLGDRGIDVFLLCCGLKDIVKGEYLTRACQCNAIKYK
jgi:hypothetical protein